jgi:GT2 family glycosyltransferase/acetyltransferase-like isoleucine patch superfamily enzyme/MoaA/NifB/PqqE/SkfB family radical SAM enzyme
MRRGINMQKTSIIILTYNNLEYNKQCIESIRRFSDENSYEIVVVDNNSTDGTVEWLKDQHDIKTIFNKENVGFPKGCNQGIELADEENDILLLNNDTIVTPNWLKNLATCLYSSKDIGAVGAVTNSCSYYQAITTTYSNIEEMISFAQSYNNSNKSMWEQRVKLVGFCMLIKRTVINKVGLLDTRFSPGNFEDDDLSFRIISAGYKLMLCKDTFIHHFGSTSFKTNPESYNNLIKENSRKFEEKWGFNVGYSTFIRNDIISQINCTKEKVINVLEVGCGCGATLLKIKDIFKNARLYGVEINPNTAKIASESVEIVGYDIENDTLTCELDTFDYIIMADVLEHLRNPWDVLKRIRQYLKRDGHIIASIPNIMHFSIIRNLLKGIWRYEESGILDKTHLRFFTLNEINNMFSDSGFYNMKYSGNILEKNNDDVKFLENISLLIDEGNLKSQIEVYQYIISADKISEKSEMPEVVRNIEHGYDLDNNMDKLLGFDTSEIIEYIISESSNSISLLNLIAITLYENEIYEDVLLYLNKSFELDRTNTDTITYLAQILDAFGEKEISMKYYQMLNKERTNKDFFPKQSETEKSPNVCEIDINYIIDKSCDVRGVERMNIGKNVVVQKDCWLNIAFDKPNCQYMIEIGQGTNIGRRSIISAANKISIGNKVLFGPNVLISDHNHQYNQIGIPIMEQGIDKITNIVTIGDGCWIGTNSVIVGNVSIGKNSVIAANSIVNKNIPAYCVAAGNPAKVVKCFDIETGRWVNVKSEDQLKDLISKRDDLLDYCIPITYLKSMQVEVSSICNLKCPQCFNNIDGHINQIMPRSLWNEKIRPYLNQIKDIHLVGIGEPLLCKDLFCFIEESKENNVTVHTTSNLQLVSEEIAKKIVLSGLDELSFSCDGVSDETYEKIRINGKFDKLKNSLELINKFKKEFNSKTPRLVLNFGASKVNIEELPEIVDFAVENNVDQIMAYHNIIYNETLKDESLYHYKELSDYMFTKAYEKAKIRGIEIFMPGLFSNPIKRCNSGIYCGYPFQHLWIYSDGRVGPCCMDFPNRLILGDLNNNSIEEIWNSKPILNLRKQLAIKPSDTCNFCVQHGKMDISDKRYFFRFKDSDTYTKTLE